LVLARTQSKKSTLAYANEHRPWELYQAVCEQTLCQCQELVRSPGGGKKFRFKNKLLSFGPEAFCTPLLIS